MDDITWHVAVEHGTNGSRCWDAVVYREGGWWVRIEHQPSGGPVSTAAVDLSDDDAFPLDILNRALDTLTPHIPKLSGSADVDQCPHITQLWWKG